VSEYLLIKKYSNTNTTRSIMYKNSKLQLTRLNPSCFVNECIQLCPNRQCGISRRIIKKILMLPIVIYVTSLMLYVDTSYTPNDMSRNGMRNIQNSSKHSSQYKASARLNDGDVLISFTLLSLRLLRR
jgi:hypothetical protein